MLSASLVTSAGNCAAAVSKITCRKRWLAVRGIALRLTITTSAQDGSATSARTTAAPTCPVPPMIKTRNAILDLIFNDFLRTILLPHTIAIDSDQQTQTEHRSSPSTRFHAANRPAFLEIPGPRKLDKRIEAVARNSIRTGGGFLPRWRAREALSG